TNARAAGEASARRAVKRKPWTLVATNPAIASAVVNNRARAMLDRISAAWTQCGVHDGHREGTMGEAPRTLCDIFLSAAASGKPDLLLSKTGGRWRPISGADFGFTVKALSLGLNALGIQPGDRVAILSENRPEWAMADYAILCAGAASVPIYPTLPANQVAPLLKDCGARAIFVSTADQLAKVRAIKAECPALEYVITVEGAPPPEAGFLSFGQAVDKGRPTLEMSPGVFEQRVGRIRPDDLATIIYTSGTTGEPKGAMLTHSNFISNVLSSTEVIPISRDTVALSFLPLSHVFERM